MTDLIVIGGGTAGLTAAIYARRAGKSVLVLEQEGFGGQIVYSQRVENYPGIASVTGAEFADQLLAQAMALGAQIELTRATGFELEGAEKTILTEDGERRCKAVILALGMKHRRLGVQGETELAGSGVSYCAVCDGAFFRDGTVAVVGGGNAALQDALHLSSLCKRVYLVHRRDAFRAEDVNVARVKEKANITLCLGQIVDQIIGKEQVTGAVLCHVQTGEKTQYALDGVFISVGRIPNTEGLKGVVTLDEQGCIVAGEDCRVGIPGVFAAGDCRTKSVRQLTTAAADGAVAALGACEYIG